MATAVGVAAVVGLGSVFPAEALPRPGADEPYEPPEPEPAPTKEPAPTVTAPPQQLQVDPGGVVAPPPTGSYNDRFYDAPTPGLHKLAAAIRIKAKSVSTLLTLPAGLNVGTTEISVRYVFNGGTQWVTQGYINGTGNRFLYNYPEGDGTRHNYGLDVLLKENGVSYYVQWLMPIEPLYTINYGPLHMKLAEDSACDWATDADPVVFYRNPTMTKFTEARLSLGAGEEAVFDSFAGTINDVGSSKGLSAHNVTWFEDDNPPWWYPLYNDFQPLPPVEQSTPLFPAPKYYKYMSFQRQEYAGDDCSAKFDYDLYYKLQTYPYL